LISNNNIDFKTAKEISLLRKEGITHVINLTAHKSKETQEAGGHKEKNLDETFT